MLTKLTAKQIALQTEVKNFWIDLLNKQTIDEKLLNEAVKFIYTKLNLPMPKIYTCSDPLKAIQQAKDMGLKDLTNIHYFGLGYDAGWFSFYDYFTRIGVINNPEFNEYSKLALCGAFAYIFADEFVIAINNPEYIKRDTQQRLHCETGPALKFKDGLELYKWHGTTVSEQLIKHPEQITKEMIEKETNTEAQRAIAEKLGWAKYMELRKVVLIDKYFDINTKCHYELYDFKQRAGDLQPRLLKMESPELHDSTKPYYIEPVPPEAKTCLAARRWQNDPSRPTIEECNNNPELVFDIER